VTKAGRKTALALGAALGLAGWTSGCGKAGQSDPAALASRTGSAPSNVVVSEPATKPLVVLHQRDDRDVVRGESFVTAHRTVVLLTFRQPNRQHEAGQVLVLDTHDEVLSSRLLPARADGEGRDAPVLRHLDDPSDRTDGIVLDLVPEVDPLGGAMVGNVHTLGRTAGLVTKPMPPPPKGARWAGPTLAWATEGELLVLVRDARGEQVFTPFGATAAALRAPREDERTPRAPVPGPAITTETRCDDAGCRTSVRLAVGDRRRAAFQGKTSGSLQQRTPVE